MQKKLNDNLKINYAYKTLEYHYKYIKPLIIAEEYLNDSININPIDYKFFCINGEIDHIFACCNGYDEVKFAYYDLNWNLLDYARDEFKQNLKFKKPKNLTQMIKIARLLSKNHVFVRVDLYEINNKIYFGELTFTPSDGFNKYYKQEILDVMGDKLKLPKYR